MMSPRAAGAALALVAATLLAIATLVPAWWTGYPEVDGHAMHMKTLDVGPLGATTCNTGGDGKCTNTSLTTAFRIVGRGEAGIDGVLALLLAALGVTTLQRKETRRAVGKLVIAATAIAGFGGVLIVILGPGIKADGHTLKVPMGYGLALFGAGIATAIAAALVTAREMPRALFIPPRPVAPPAPQFDVGALFAGDEIAPPVAAPMPAIPTMNGLQLPQMTNGAPPPMSRPMPPMPTPPRTPTLPPPLRSPTLPPPSPALAMNGAMRSPTAPPPMRSNTAPPPMPGLPALPPMPGFPPRAKAPSIAPPPPFDVLPKPLARARANMPTVQPPLGEPPNRKSIPPAKSFVLPMDTSDLPMPGRPPVADDELDGETNDAALPDDSDETRNDVRAAPPAADTIDAGDAGDAGDDGASGLGPAADGASDLGPRASGDTAPSPVARASDATIAVPPIDPEIIAGDHTSPNVPIDPEEMAAADAAVPSPEARGPRPEAQRAPNIPITTASAELPPPVDATASSGPTPACPQCEAPMAWVDEHLRFYCKSCRMYF